jgi:hypothetical protein
MIPTTRNKHNTGRKCDSHSLRSRATLWVRWILLGCRWRWGRGCCWVAGLLGARLLGVMWGLAGELPPQRSARSRVKSTSQPTSQPAEQFKSEKRPMANPTCQPRKNRRKKASQRRNDPRPRPQAPGSQQPGSRASQRGNQPQAHKLTSLPTANSLLCA